VRTKKIMQNGRKIGVFDSGLGGLFIANSIRSRLPQYDYIFLGDTLNVPYGRRSDDAIYTLCETAMRYLFAQGCELVVIACNTASVSALRRLQQGFLANEFPDKRILGVVVPTLEVAIEQGVHNIGLIATERTVSSNIYEIELQKINADVRLHAVATPLLVPLVEHEGSKYYDIVLRDYLQPLLDKKVESLILGCTHYIALKDTINNITDNSVRLIAQDEIIPEKLADYLIRHPDMEQRLSKGGTFEARATDLNESFQKNIKDLAPKDAVIKLAQY
jgi:glutamate racemase